MNQKNVIIVTGRSGSGKGTALAAFEDSGYYCVDNMPVALLPNFLDFSPKGKTGFAGFVFGMDLRDNNFIDQYKLILDQLEKKGFCFRIIFLEADKRVLMRRYNQTRRRHPFAMDKNIHDAIQIENSILGPLRKRADHVIDTTDLNVHELKAVIRKMALAEQRHDPMRVQVMSFGFKFGLPLQSDLVMDVRFLKNPFFIESLRPLSGESEKIQSYVLNNGQTCLFLQKYFELLDILIPHYQDEGKSYLTIAIGCTGGRHRSVVIAIKLRDHFRASSLDTELIHRDIDRIPSRRENHFLRCSKLSDER